MQMARPDSSGGSSIADEIVKLMKLKEAGAIDEAEFKEAKAKLLDLNA